MFDGVSVDPPDRMGSVLDDQIPPMAHEVHIDSSQYKQDFRQPPAADFKSELDDPIAFQNWQSPSASSVGRTASWGDRREFLSNLLGNEDKSFLQRLGRTCMMNCLAASGAIGGLVSWRLSFLGRRRPVAKGLTFGIFFGPLLGYWGTIYTHKDQLGNVWARLQSRAAQHSDKAPWSQQAIAKSPIMGVGRLDNSVPRQPRVFPSHVDLNPEKELDDMKWDTPMSDSDQNQTP
eukprot:GHVT01079527.1.p1 GENE.GHVT01079527.1~~GHVT01079527.1.p1  ORF type:complete len:274 (+),score=15.56 GHVT01079527.1:126-824(+)